jgi:hypothetical protein
MSKEQKLDFGLAILLTPIFIFRVPEWLDNHTQYTSMIVSTTWGQVRQLIRPMCQWYQIQAGNGKPLNSLLKRRQIYVNTEGWSWIKKGYQLHSTSENFLYRFFESREVVRNIGTICCFPSFNFKQLLHKNNIMVLGATSHNNLKYIRATWEEGWASITWCSIPWRTCECVILTLHLRGGSISSKCGK